MKKTTILLIAALIGPILLSGCVGTGPNTQQGAVTGGALGALAGAIIGNNSRGGNALQGAVIGGAAGAIAGGTIGNSIDHQQGTIYGYERATASAPEVEQVPPPPPPQATEVVMVAPASNAVWVPGYWAYSQGGYYWIAGHWEIPPPGGQAYVSAHWERRHGRHMWVRGYWR